MKVDGLCATVVIPTYQKVERLRLVLETFRLQTVSKDRFEIVVIDDGSTDGTQELLASVDLPLFFRWIRQPHQGRSSARNTGIAASRHPLLIFCDDDTLPHPRYIEAHLQAHGEDERVAIHGRIYSLPYLKFFRDPASGKLYDDQVSLDSQSPLHRLLLAGPSERVLQQAEQQKKLALLERQIEQILSSKNHPMPWLGFTGGNVSVRRAVIEEVGRFDVQFGLLWGGEDLELGYRMVERGVAVRYGQAAASYHMNHYRSGYREELDQSVQLFFRKHPDPLVRNLAALLLGEIPDPIAYVGATRQ
jgi:glycosyltransferase involved in cell wall biosynthesis